MSGLRSSRAGSNCGRRGFRRNPQRDLGSRRRQFVLPCPLQVHDQARNRRTGLIQPVAHRLHAIFAHRDAVLVRTGTSVRQIQQYALGRAGRAHVRGHRPAEHNSYLCLRAMMLHGYALDGRGGIGGPRQQSSASQQRQHQQQSAAYAYFCPHSAAPLSASSCRHNWKTPAHCTPPLPILLRTSVASLPAGMARITASGVVHIVRHTSMVGIRVRLAVRVTVDAGEGGVIGRINVARSARSPHAGMRAGINREPGVIKGGSCPRSGVVAQRAGGGEGRRGVVGISGALIIRLMAGVAVRGRSRKLAVNVATGAGHGGVRAGQREGCGVVVEARGRPGRRRMAHLTLLREPSCCVIRVIGVLEVLQVAGHALSAQVGELPARVAALALQGGVRPRKREPAQRVVERRIGPGNCAVADGTIGGESAGNVVRVSGLLEICHVARRARGRHRRIAAVHVALRAGQLGVRAAQRPSRHGMVEVHVHPRTGVMAAATTGGESGIDVIGIVGRSPVLGVATQAVHGRAFEAATYVARGAVQRGVHAGEGKTGKAQVVEFGSEPGIHAVACLAGSRETRSRVIGIAGLLELRPMAAQTVGGEPLELAHRGVLVAAVALQQRVRSHQRKTVEVLLDVLHRNSPPFHVVAVFAVRSKLAAVNVGVAVRAFRAGIAEHQVRVALAARNSFVHPAQGKLRLIVIKFRNVADWLPGGEGMAVLAGEIQVAVRAARGGVS